MMLEDRAETMHACVLQFFIEQNGARNIEEAENLHSLAQTGKYRYPVILLNQIFSTIHGETVLALRNQ